MLTVQETNFQQIYKDGHLSPKDLKGGKIKKGENPSDRAKFDTCRMVNTKASECAHYLIFVQTQTVINVIM